LRKFLNSWLKITFAVHFGSQLDLAAKALNGYAEKVVHKLSTIWALLTGCLG
jgi:hypothetical protein